MDRPFVQATATMLDGGCITSHKCSIDNLKANMIPTFAFHSLYPASMSKKVIYQRVL